MNRILLEILIIHLQLIGDATICWPVYEALRKQVETMNSSVYFYNFAYEGTFSITMDEKGVKKPGKESLK